MKTKIWIPGIIIFLLLCLTMSGCQLFGGITQEQYDQLSAQLSEAQAQLADAQSQLDQAQSKIDSLEKQKDGCGANLEDAQATISALQSQLQDLQNENSLVGATPAETAQKIVKYYHETHVYDLYDLFVCSDMAAEIWNMLKAQGIDSLITVGDIDQVVTDIVLCDHAWVLAEVEPGTYLALETTGGFSVPSSQNPLYYRGWVFKSPADLKSYNSMIKEYNVRVTIRNEIAAVDRDIVDEYNKTFDQKLLAVHDQLVEIVQQQEVELNDLMAEINKLAAALA